MLLFAKLRQDVIELANCSCRAKTKVSLTKIYFRIIMLRDYKNEILKYLYFSNVC